MAVSGVAAVARFPGGPLAIEPIELDALRDDEVLVRIAAVGLCHTDLVFGAQLGIMRAPAVLGHEGAGVIMAVGAGVTKVEPGDHAVLTFNSCGTCPRCGDGRPAYCFDFAPMNYSGRRSDGSSPVSIGGEGASADFFGQSSFASHAIAHERNVVKIDRDVPLDIMGPLGCGVQTGAGAIVNSLACRKGSSLLIVGAGAVGLSAVLAAVIRDCATIIVAEPRGERRELAIELGATHTIDPVGIDLASVVRAIVPQGVDYAFDTSGLAEVISAASGALAPRGILGLVGVAAPHADQLTIPINRTVGAGHIIMGIIEGDSQPDKFIPQMIKWYREGRFPFDRLLTRYALTQINEAIADQHAGRCVKPLLIPA